MLLENSYKIKTLADSPEYFDQVIHLIEKNFGYILPHRYFIDFYPLMNKKNHEHCFLLMKDQELVGHIGVKTHQIAYDQFDFKASLLGGICIDEKYQGQGIFTPFFAEVMKRYHDSAMMILWSDKHELYQKYDFDLAGVQYCYMGVDQVHPDEKNLNELNDFEWKKIQRLFDKVLKEDVLHIKRNESDWDDFRQMSSVKALLFYENNELIGYALKNKGMDLGGIVHEYIHLDPRKNLDNVLNWGTLWSYDDYMVNGIDEVKQGLALIRCNIPSLKMVCSQFSFFIGGVESI